MADARPRFTGRVREVDGVPDRAAVAAAWEGRHFPFFLLLVLILVLVWGLNLSLSLVVLAVLTVEGRGADAVCDFVFSMPGDRGGLCGFVGVIITAAGMKS